MNISGISSQIASSVFAKIDTNNQGYIDKTAFTAAIGGDDTAGSEEAFKVLDSDSDGQLTKSELTKGIENLLSELNSASLQAQNEANRPAPPAGGPPPPPPPQGEQEDSGLTQEEMTKMASETSDTKLSGMLTQVASNFEAADTNQDGKVTQQEAIAYQKSQSETSLTANADTTQSSDIAKSKIAQLLSQYLSDSTTSSSAGSVSLTA